MFIARHTPTLSSPERRHDAVHAELMLELPKVSMQLLPELIRLLADVPINMALL